MRLLSLALLIALSAPVAAQSETEACHVDGLSTLVECGELSVPLDYDEPGGEQITLGFVRLASFNESSSSNPIFFLAGGPGQSATSLTNQVSEMLADARSDRDIVLIDQRGTGRSAALICEPPEPEDLVSRYDLIDLDLLADCIAGLPEGIEHFTTANAIRDFERVREHLGYSAVDLYGGSYGSRAALAYLGIAGDSVGAVILDGISPPSVPIGLFGASAADAFERAATRCERIDACAAAYPNLRADFAAVDAQLREGPVEARVPHPTTGAMTDLRLWHGQFISLLRLTLYSPQTTALLPMIISEAAAGNYLPLVGLSAGSGDAGAVNLMVNLAIVCNEDYVRFSEVAIRDDADNSFGRDTSFRLWNEACPLMPSFAAERAWMSAGPFPQPALLLSGAGDPVTPPSNGEIAAGLFDSVVHLIAPESAHIVGSTECGGQLIASFLKDPTAPINSDCLNDTPVQRFYLNTLGSLSVGDSTTIDAEATSP